jgi:hypothetical protein
VTYDLAVVVPDKDIEQAIRGVAARPAALGIRPIEVAVLVHPHRDPGVYRTAEQLLQPLRREASHALAVFDRAWEGAPSSDPLVLAAHVESRLHGAWGSRGRAVVIDPEVEVWVWSPSPHVDAELGWEGRNPNLREWLRARGLWASGTLKPADPKAALRAALREVRKPPSSAIFARLAARVSLERCSDPSFLALRGILRHWFGSSD